jgi:hypothetical protein
MKPWLIGALTVVSLSPALLAQSRWTPARTPDGHVDMQGNWGTSTMTPLERPSEMRDKPSLTKREAEAYEKRMLEQSNRDRRDGSAEADVARAYNELFFERGAGLARIGQEYRTSIVVDPPDGRIPPLTAEAQKKVAQDREYARQHPADRAQDRSLTERCLYWSTAGPPMLPGPYNNNYQIVQTPGYVVILSEMIHDARIIPMDGRPHLPGAVRGWLGDSRGHWEGDTLVVETTNLNGRTQFHGADENLRVTERFTRIDADTIVYRFTIDDPTAFTKPWTGELPFTASSSPVYEYACQEGNEALPDILRGARAKESK